MTLLIRKHPQPSWPPLWRPSTPSLNPTRIAKVVDDRANPGQDKQAAAKNNPVVYFPSSPRHAT